MSTDTDTYARARINTATKQHAADTLNALSLSISDAVRLLLIRIAEETAGRTDGGPKTYSG